MTTDKGSLGFKAAAVQMRSGLDRRVNTQVALNAIDHAARQGAKFISTPEMTTVLDRQSARLFESLRVTSVAELEMPAFSQAARKHGVWLHIGSMPVPLTVASDGDASQVKIANRAHLFSPDGTCLTTYDKIHMFDVQLETGEQWRESALYKPGTTARVADMGIAKLGLSICYDVRFPLLYRTMAKSGANLFVVPAAFTKPTGKAHWRSLLRARAIECGAFVIAAAQGGLHEDGRETYGHSLIINPWGEVIAEADDNESGVIFATIDIDASARARRQIPNLGLDATFTLEEVKS